jgi:tyrosine-specific transport protein
MKSSSAGVGLVISVAFLITGNLIGAGILALPVNTGLSGFLPSMVGLLVMCGMMFFSAVVLAREATDTQVDNFNYPSLYHRYLGGVGKWAAVLANLLILYGLLTAYLTGGTTVIVQLFDIPSGAGTWAVTIGLFVAMTGITVLGETLIRKCNTVLMVLLWGSFAVIVFMALQHVEVKRLAFTDWMFLPATFPVIITAFHFHNIIPSVCGSLEWRWPRIMAAMTIGMIIGLVMNASWILVGVGALPLKGAISLGAAFDAGVPATVPLAEIIHSSFFTTSALTFALLAIVTSYVANGIGLLGFIQDMTVNFLKVKSRLLVVVLTFLPPLLIAFCFPNVFLNAMNLVGGVGIVILFGVLPSIIAAKKAGSRKALIWALLMLVLFTLFLLLEVGQESGVTQISPDREYWPDEHWDLPRN